MWNSRTQLFFQNSEEWGSAKFDCDITLGELTYTIPKIKLKKTEKIEVKDKSHKVQTKDIDGDGKSDLHYEDAEKVLVWLTSKGGSLSEVQFKNSKKNLLTDNFAIEVADNLKKYSQDSVSGDIILLSDGTDYVNFKVVSKNFYGYVEEYVTIHFSDIHYMINYYTDKSFNKEIPNPTPNYIRLKLGLDTTEMSEVMGDDYLILPPALKERYYAYKFIGMKNKDDYGIGLYWLYPKMIAKVDKNECMLIKYGFAPYEGEIWQLECSLIIGSNMSANIPDCIDKQNVPRWIMPPINQQHISEEEREMYKILKELLPKYQDRLVNSKIEGSMSTYPTPDGPLEEDICSVFNDITSSIAFNRIGMPDRSLKILRFLKEFQHSDGSWYHKYDRNGNPIVKEGIAQMPTYVMAVYSYYLFTKDKEFLNEFWQSVEKPLNEIKKIIQPSFASYIGGMPFQAHSVGALECGARMAEILGKPDEAEDLRENACRCSLLINGLQTLTRLCHGFSWFSPLRAEVLQDEYIQRWYEITWNDLVGEEGVYGWALGGGKGSVAAGETVETVRGIFWNRQLAIDTMRSMYKWAWRPSVVLGEGGFRQWKETHPDEIGLSDRAIWTQSEALIYYTLDMRDYGLTISQPFAVPAIELGKEQEISVRAQDTRTGVAPEVILEFDDKVIPMERHGFTYIYKWIPEKKGLFKYKVYAKDKSGGKSASQISQFEVF